MPETKMRCLIWGAGAIGGTLGAYLARTGHDVTFVDAADEHVAAIDRAGLHITGPSRNSPYARLRSRHRRFAASGTTLFSQQRRTTPRLLRARCSHT